ncbi:hypothetical protein Gogos_009260, partial [Gossypium gossypioides]|nr:hypothetical protein [Gossypium gossypioides]
KSVDRHTHYLFPFNKNVEDFLEKEKTLINSQIRLQEDVKMAKRKNQKIEKVVEDWLSKVLCKEMYEKTLAITLLIETSKFDRVAFPWLEFLPPMYAVASKSSTFALNEIMEALEDDEINMIGVRGIRGVGKTTLVRALGNKIKESQLFDDVAIAVVSETPDLGKIQDKITDSLDIKFERRSREGKGKELWVELEMKKRFLIILDDICDELNLIRIGIPFDEEEAPSMFKLHAGLDNASPNTVEVAMKVAQECIEAWNLFKLHARLDKVSPAMVKVEDAK